MATGFAAARPFVANRWSEKADRQLKGSSIAGIDVSG
jgi:hypothetical protein